MKCQVLFSLKNTKIKERMSSAANLTGALRVKNYKVIDLANMALLYFPKEHNTDLYEL